MGESAGLALALPPSGGGGGRERATVGGAA